MVARVARPVDPVTDGQPADPQCVGLGMGLAVVQTIVQSHGGTVPPTSEGSEGSEITLKLPIVTSGCAFYGSV